MKGNPKIIEGLNKALGLEYGAVIQYVTHASILDNWGYKYFAEYVMQRAKDEMRHADMLVDHIMFLEGKVTISPVGTKIGNSVPEMLPFDHNGEHTAIAVYNEIVKMCIVEGDNGTRKIIDSILADEEGHINKIEEDQQLLKDLGLPLFLSKHIED